MASTTTTPVTLNHTSYPHILDNILQNSPWECFLAWRTSSHEIRDRLDTHLSRHLIVTPRQGNVEALSVTTPSSRRHPAFANWDDGENIDEERAMALKHIREIVKDTKVVDLCEAVPYESFVPVAMALKDVPMVRLRRNPQQHPFTEMKAKTRVVFTELLGQHPVTGVPIPPSASIVLVPHPVEKLVVNIRYDPGHPLLHRGHIALFEPRPPASLQQVVVKISASRKVAASDDQLAYAAFGMGGWLNHLATWIMALPADTAVTIVDIDEFDPQCNGLSEMPMSKAELEETVREIFIQATWQLHGDLIEEQVGQLVDMTVDFKTADEYRESLGSDEQFELETTEIAVERPHPIFWDNTDMWQVSDDPTAADWM